ncbi:MAG TPA: zinc ribbon domain-containing protein [Thermoanaerobaculia bacterium]|nr:zinc ribbon domain-containing protein [Thermoanaerobaculia bacterium]
MPIYEFYCQACHAVFSFFIASSGAARRPACPRCGRGELPRRPSSFAMLRGRSESTAQEGEPSPLDELDETRMGDAMETLMREMGELDGDADPRRVGAFFRRFSDLAGLEMGPRMEDALARLEAGQELDELEAELEDLGEEDSLDDLFRLKKAAERRRRRPDVDPELYFL